MELKSHPCFNEESKGKYGRVHLPIAPDCNVKCRFCNRKFDCVNESRPGVTSRILNSDQCVAYLEKLLQKDPRIKVAGVAGPGDAFADPMRTIDALQKVRSRFPELLLCIATNGLSLAPWVDELSKLNISHVTVTVNAVDPKIGADIYSWVRYNKKVLRGLDAATVLLENQEEAIRKLKEKNIIVKINSVILPGINEHHTVKVASTVASWGANIFNALPLLPAEGSDFAHLQPPTHHTVATIREQAEAYLPQMRHCGRCRADAAGLLGESEISGIAALLDECTRISPSETRPSVAVASREGLLVNMHLGEAPKLMVYKCDEKGNYVKTSEREAPPKGLGAERWKLLAQTFSDCCAILVSGAGENPVRYLEEQGIRIIQMNSLIEDGLDHIYKGTKAPPLPVKLGCGSGCSGNGAGCV